MSLHSVPPVEAGQNPAGNHSTGKEPEAPPQSRARVLRYRLGYAAKNIPTSPADVKRKKPLLVGWQEKATTDPRRIHMESQKWPDAGVLMPTGKRNGRWVLDVDSFEDLERLEKKLGVKLRSITTEVKTQSNRLQLHFLWPDDEGPDIRNSTGKNVKDGYEKLDARGEGGLVLLPPSAGYEFANHLPSIEAPAELVEWARNRKGGSGRSSRHSDQMGGAPRKVDIPDDGPIPDGGRHDELARIAGRLHDGTRSLDQITEELLEVNESRCVPPIGSPGDDPLDDVVRIAQWIYSKEPYKPAREHDPEVEEILQNASDYWYENFLPRGGGSKLRDVYRAAHDSAAKRRELRTVIVDGQELRGAVFSDSCRQIAEAANTSAMSASNNLRKLREVGAIVQVEKRDGIAPTWLLVEPGAHYLYTPNNVSPPEERGIDGGVKVVRADELETPVYGWRSPVGNAGGGVKVALEAFGPQTTEELAERLGISRVRDLERRRLAPLAALGEIEERDGCWALPDDHRERTASQWDEPYATVHRRRMRRRTDEGRTVVEVEEIVKVASERERIQERRDNHAKDREMFRRHRAERRKAVEDECLNGTPAPDGPAFEELPPVEKGQRPEGEGWRLRYERGYWSWVNAETGEMKEIARSGGWRRSSARSPR